MLRTVNMGAFRRAPVYRARSVFRGLGQEDTTVPLDFSSPDVSVPAPDISVPADITPPVDVSPPVDQAEPLTMPADANTSAPQVTTSEATPSQLSPGASQGTSPSTAPAASSGGGATSSAAAAGGSDLLSTVGKFFTGLFTPSNIQAAANAAKSATAKKPTATPTIQVPGVGAIPIDTGTILMVGGVVVTGIVVVSFLTRP